MTLRPMAPTLGHLAAPPSPAPFDDLRLMLLEDVVMAADDASSIDREWAAAWTRTIAAMRDRVIATTAEELEAAGRRSRYPSSRLAELLPDEEAADRLLHRLLAEGMPLERFEGSPVDAEGLRHRGAALELAWEGAVRVAVAERARWRGVASRVAGWRRPWRPLVITAVVLLALATVLALVLGGFLPAPPWFQPVVDGFWEVPWP